MKNIIKHALYATLALLGVTGHAFAASITYGYGNAFWTINDPALGTTINGSVTFDNTIVSEIAANSTGSIWVPFADITALSFSSSPSVSFSLSDITEASIELSNGQIYSWDIIGQAGPYELESSGIAGGGVGDGGDVILYNPNPSTFLQNESPLPGNWSNGVITSVPEPEAWAMLLIGFPMIVRLFALNKTKQTDGRRNNSCC